ncbi:chemotaxis protein [Bradyrhizobium diazoefficiens]|nr:chemotaxis protein [Bradyrhizobium diazoefficiens]UCF54630.1 MAG: chemotaxis protein [Bradyrhizobium sp.]MBR0963560.1 chemotaxis protein [Bradyrhizobium diazoefficiens]MBR0976373.1 chemotaxis protein [Bradyrhizobium diazoefficiens]MBR1007221.1 chemotaxis protein [Bradyrhizobium diazoefficiens]MBR1013333.1 chemotaxis protein [Bradyrhizobium diazoefficiens]
MIRSLLRAALLLLLSLTAVQGFADPAPGPGEPYELVRTLQAVQDGIAHGDMAAHGDHIALIRQIGEKFLAADAGVWSHAQNGQAVVIYLLSGGGPQLVRKLPRDRLNVDERLFSGALAYVEGRQDDARDLLKDVKPRMLPSGLGGQVALVQGALFARSEASLAIERLDDARLLLPGTLVEEAALRREILLVGQAEDFDKFEFLTLAYIRHYRNSVYAGDFWQRFSSGLTQSSLALDERRFARIVTLLEQLDRASRLKLYFVIARNAMLRGRLAVALLAGERALVLSADASADRERAHFFRGTARVLTDEYDGGLAELKALDRSKLPERDIPLLNATVQLALDMRKPFAGKSAAAADEPAVTPARLDLALSTATLARARTQLGELERLTKGRRP